MQKSYRNILSGSTFSGILLSVLLSVLLLMVLPSAALAAESSSSESAAGTAETKAAAVTHPDGFVKTAKGKQYYKNGVPVKKKWITVKKKKYYFDKKGYMVTGKKTISKKLCYFSKKGVLTRSINKKGKMVALTYDDGPSVYTPIILSALKKNDGLATFFVVGNRVNQYKKQLKQAYKMGCEIGNHSWDHSNLSKLSASSLRSQLNRTNKAVKKITGKKPVLLRPPYGSSNSTVASNAKMPLILWSIDTLDWKTRSTSATISCIKREVRDGDIILMHDIHKPTAEAAKTIVPWLVDQGYQLVTVSEMAECRGKLKKGTKYYSIRK